MLLDGQDIQDLPILSLQTGSELARTDHAIINPHNLSIVAYEVTGQTLDHHPSLLRIEDIRELSPVGMIIDSSDEFVQPDDVVKLKELYDLSYNLIDTVVLDEKRNKLGKVSSYTLESGSFVIQQLIVKRPLLQSFNDSELIVHRSQIIEITDDAIVIKSKADAVTTVLPKTSRTYVNPFRQSGPQPESVRSDRN